MVKIEEIEKLAELSRITLAPEEKESIRKDIESILDYVAEVKEASASLASLNSEGLVKNVMREDEISNKSGEYSQDLLKEAPRREGNYVKVKKIL
jgi:aspartyl-tRNA(Asn)/glutamyl-tRNA(Gln) amidotransferase subunit C